MFDRNHVKIFNFRKLLLIHSYTDAFQKGPVKNTCTTTNKPLVSGIAKGIEVTIFSNKSEL